MYPKNTVDLWSTAFSFSKEEEQQIIEKIKSCTPQYDSRRLLSYLDSSNAYEQNEEYGDYVKACETVALEFCLVGTRFAREVLSEEAYKKACDLFKRRQFTGVIKDLLAMFVDLLRFEQERKTRGPINLKLYFLKDIQEEFLALRDAKAEKTFSQLKKQIEKISSGVKSNCYFDAESPHYFTSIDERRFYCSDAHLLSKELLDFVQKKYGYRFPNVPYSFYGGANLPLIYKRALFDSPAFWEKHPKFNIWGFLKSVEENNGLTHAKKILTYMFDRINSDPLGEQLLKNNLSLAYLYKETFLANMQDRVFSITFHRFEGLYPISKIEHKTFCYPLVSDDSLETRLARGKKVINGLFEAVYPFDYQAVLSYFNEQLDEEKHPLPEFHKIKLNVRELFIVHTFGFWDSASRTSEYRAAQFFCPEYFSAQNLWNRLYLLADAALTLESDRAKCYANLFESFYDFFLLIEKELKYETSFQRNTEGRDRAYQQLKKMLKKYNINISENHKADYIISLLDRKVALFEESARFPVLEQLGDAVYGFALAEMMYYQPAEIEDESILKKFQEFIQAETQVKLARMLGIDQLYLSSLSLSYKYALDIWVQPDHESFVIFQENSADAIHCKQKYLADSLEMIIGTICNDCGYQVAVQFVKDLLKKCFSDVFTGEIRWEMRDQLDADADIDINFWRRIMPSPDPDFDNYWSKHLYEEMYRALTKFMLAYCIGTDTVEKRTFLTKRFSHADEGDALYGKERLGRFPYNHAMFVYLHCGLAAMVEKYAPIIQENYKNLDKTNL